jgi:hypothetical protein
MLRVHDSLTKKMSWIEDMVMRSNSILGVTNNQPSNETALVQQKILISFISEVLFDFLKKKLHFEDEKDLFNKKLVRRFVRRVFAEVSCNPVCNVVSVIYFERFLADFPFEIDMTNWKFYYGICVVCGCKMWEDRVYTNTTYMQDMEFEKDISLQKFNALEKTALKVLNYELFVSFQTFRQFINEHSKNLSSLIKGGLNPDAFRDSFILDKKE